MIVGLLIAAGGATLLISHIDIAVHASPTVEARVVGYQRDQRCRANDGCDDIYRPAVTYTAGTHGTVTATVDDIEPFSPIAKGTILKVKYNESDPTIVHSASTRWWSTWGTPSIVILFGAFIIWVCIPNRHQRAS